MKRLARAARLAAADRALLVRAALLVATIRVLLWSIPWPGVLRAVRALPSVVGPRAANLPAERLAWAVRAASRFLPAATCLTQSLALQSLLAATGRAGTVEIGVRKDDGPRMQAHAWVELDGRALLSTPDEIDRYAHMLTLRSPVLR